MTCTQAIAEIFANETGVLSTREVIERVYARHPDRPWKENTIQAHLVGLSVNHTSGHHYPWLHKQAFLYATDKGRYRRWDPERDVMSGAGGETEPDEGIAEDEETPGLYGAIDTTVSLERDLEKALIQNLGQLEAGLQLYREGGQSGQQLDTGAVGRIDILAVDTRGGLVIIELKAGRAGDQVCGQVLRYVGWVHEHLAQGRPVRGIIVADEFDESLEYAAKAMPNVALKRYAVRFDFSDV